MTNGEYDYPACQGAPAGKLGTLESVTMRYKRKGDVFEVRINAEEAAKIGGILWNDAFVNRVTTGGSGGGGGSGAGMDKRCRPLGQNQSRPIKVFKVASGGNPLAVATEEPETPSGNCYYHNGRIICC
jgi:hypothetical protein